MSWTIRLRPREPPLPAVAVVATGAALPGLTSATRRALDAGAELRAAAGEDWLVVLGASDDLPWADGCRYLGAEGPLLVPTTRALELEPPRDVAAPPPGGPAVADLVAATLGGAGLVVVLEDVVLRGPRPADVAAL